MSGPRVLVVEARGAKLHVHRRSIVVETREGRYTVPVAEVDRVVIVTSQVSITSAAVRRLAKLGIDILFLDARGTPIVTLTPPWISSTSETRIAQYRAATDPATSLHIARAIVRAKVMSQAHLLESLAVYRKEAWLRQEAEVVKKYAVETVRADSIERLRVLEAHAARRYWGALASLVPRDVGFQGRDPDADDDLNTMLNYLYALLYAWVHRYLVMYGLDPYVGFIHADRSGRPTLVYDIAELFRVAAVDRLALRMLTEGWRPERDQETGLLSSTARAELIKRFTTWVRERVVVDWASGRKDTLERHMAHQARLLASTVRRGVGDYTPFIEAVSPP